MKATLEDLVNALTQHMTAVDIAQTAMHIEISRMIRSARRQINLSQKAMAEKMGVKQSMISRWESGDCNYTIDTLVEIADALGLSVQCPLTFDEVNLSAQPTEIRSITEKTVVEEKTVFSNAIRFDFKKSLNGGAA